MVNLRGRQAGAQEGPLQSDSFSSKQQHSLGPRWRASKETSTKINHKELHLSAGKHLTNKQPAVSLSSGLSHQWVPTYWSRTVHVILCVICCTSTSLDSELSVDKRTEGHSVIHSSVTWPVMTNLMEIWSLVFFSLDCKYWQQHPGHCDPLDHKNTKNESLATCTYATSDFWYNLTLCWTFLLIFSSGGKRCLPRCPVSLRLLLKPQKRCTQGGSDTDPKRQKAC